VPEPVCSDTQVKVKPAFVGICGTDLHEYSSSTFIPEKGCPHPVTGEARPLTIGHEISGTVIEVGKNVTNKAIKVGSRVACRPTVCCFECPACLEGHYSCCATPGFLGLSGGGGGMSDTICLNSEFVHALPDNIDLDVGGQYTSTYSTHRYPDIANTGQRLLNPCQLAGARYLRVIFSPAQMC
jgi:threonine dehydrogenase-like Zn-dependent dehydrogenase